MHFCEKLPICNDEKESLFLFLSRLCHTHFVKDELPRGRWGEVDKEKGPGDLFPTEPTDEAVRLRRP